MSSATPPGPYPSYVISSYETPGSSPVPRRIARSMFSRGMLFALASAMIVRKRGLVPGSPPPLRAATVNSLMMRVKALPRLASAAPFLCLIVCHLEWPDMAKTPEKTTEKDLKSYHDPCKAGRRAASSGAAQQHPGVGPRIPGPTLVVAEHGVDREPGALQPARHGRYRQRAEGQCEVVDTPVAAARGRVALIEDREAARPVLTDRLDEAHAGVRAHPAAERALAFVLGPVGQIGHEIDAEASAASEYAVD